MSQSKVVILEKSQRRREYLRALVSDWGHLTFIFEKAAICLDNLHSLEPDLVISGPLSHGRMDRFVSTVKMMDGDLPVLIISSDPSFNNFAAYNGFKDVKINIAELNSGQLDEIKLRSVATSLFEVQR